MAEPEKPPNLHVDYVICYRFGDAGEWATD